MNQFKKQFRNLPWAEPSAHLRQRIFGDAKLESYPIVYRFFNRAARWAAVWVVIGSVIGYSVGRGQNNASALVTSPGDVTVVETDTDTLFFNQTDESNEAIPGKWVLQVDPAGGIQG